MPTRILIVDDEKEFTMVLRRKLELEGYEIEEAHRGSDVLPRLYQRPFDVVLLDYMMPDVRGHKVCEMIRSEEKFENLPVIVVTAYHDQSESALKAYGATEVFYKPVSAEDLIDAIKRNAKA